MDFETHHHTVLQIEVLNHEVGYTLLHHLVGKSVPNTSRVHNFHLKALCDTLKLGACNQKRGERTKPCFVLAAGRYYILLAISSSLTQEYRASRIS